MAGKFASAPSSSLCLDCELGRFSRDGAPRCSQCGNGSVANGISARCFDCVPGRYSDAERVLCVPCKPGQTSGPRADVCVDCESGKVALSPGSALCVSCAQGLFANANHTLCESCPAGRGGYNGACVDCQPGQVSQDDVCRSCGDSGYTLQPRQTTCLPCTGRGFSCVDGWPQIAEGFWGFVDPTGRVVARQCPPDVCNGGPLFSADSCAANRQPVESNPLVRGSLLLLSQRFLSLRASIDVVVAVCLCAVRPVQGGRCVRSGQHRLRALRIAARCLCLPAADAVLAGRHGPAHHVAGHHGRKEGSFAFLPLL